jgi:hypothetical protein
MIMQERRKLPKMQKFGALYRWAWVLLFLLLLLLPVLLAHYSEKSNNRFYCIIRN